jgi:hypothetical protein
MFLLLSLFTILFVTAGFLSTSLEKGGRDPFTAYFLSEIHFIGSNWFIFLLLFLLLTILFLRSLKFEKKYTFLKRFFYSGLHVFTAGSLGMLFSFVILCTIAVVQLNIASIMTNTNQKITGVVSDKKEIYNILKNNNRPPEIIATDKDPYKELLAITAATTGTTNYYGGTLIRSIPNFLVVPVKKRQSGMMLLDNTLIVSEINQEDVQTLSPAIGYLLLKHYFPTKKIKSYPKVSVMDQKEYQMFKRRENTIKLSRIDADLLDITGKISSISASIEADKKILAASESAKTNNVPDREVLKKKLEEEQQLLFEFQYLEKFYVTQKKLLEELSIDASHEQGVFIPRDEIKIVYKTKDPHAIADYFATLVHEYLHYASFVSDKKMLRDAFFEEGLTEYFARMSIQTDLQTSTNLGYPVHAKIISEMTNLIPESEFSEIYFTKDQQGLEYALNRVYGDTFYRETRIAFESLHYSSKKSEVLQLANFIMKKIGGKELTEKDLYSSFSKI